MFGGVYPYLEKLSDAVCPAPLAAGSPLSDMLRAGLFMPSSVPVPRLTHRYRLRYLYDMQETTTTKSRYHGAGVSWRPATDSVEIGTLIRSYRSATRLLPILAELTRVSPREGARALERLLDMGFGGDEERGIVLDETPLDEIQTRTTILEAGWNDGRDHRRGARGNLLWWTPHHRC